MDENAKPSAQCQRCGAPLLPDAPEGLCPRCLVALNLTAPTEIPDETGPHGTKVVKPPPAPDEIARHFPQLQILECLGRGGMGVVYKARQPRLDRLVALKILAPEKEKDPQFAERFAREAKALARLNHPNIVTVHDFGESDGLFYLMMEYVDGASLRQLIRTRKLTPPEALAIVPKICEALQFAHDKGVVHRDIKPENVLVDTSGQVKIADFGIAKIVGAEGRAGSPLPAEAAQPVGGARLAGAERPPGSLTQDQVIGTPQYMAPEQMETPQLVDHRADIYSLGVVFYEMLTGELPLGKFQPPSKKVQVDVRLDEVVLHALEKEPERRYQQASEVKSDVETIATTRRSAAASAAPLDAPSTGTSGKAFDAAPKAAREPRALAEPRLSRTAIWGAVVASFPLLALLGYIFARIGGLGLIPLGLARVFLPVFMLLFGLMGFVAPLATTILGWTAVSQIRRSAGRLYGLGLAVFDGLLFPLLALDWLLVFCGGLVAEGFEEFKVDLNKPLLAGSILAALAIDFFITRAVWRAVNKPVIDATHPGPPAPIRGKRGGHALKVALVTLIAAAALVFVVIPVGGILLGIIPPTISKARNAADKTQETASTVQFRFGPLVEQVLESRTAIDFDSGRQVRVPEFDAEQKRKHSAITRAEATAIWLVQQGMDGMYVAKNSKHDDLFDAIDMKVKALKNQDWSAMSLPQLAEVFRSMELAETLRSVETPRVLRSDGQKSPSEFPLNIPADGPATYAFQTREGSRGILQVAFTDQTHDSVKIRYKLVQRTKSETASVPSLAHAITNVVQVRWLRSRHMLGVYHWRIERPTPCRLACGVLDVTDADHAQAVLTSVERRTVKGTNDFALRLERQGGTLRLLIENPYLLDKRSANVVSVDVETPLPQAELRVAVRDKPITLSSEHYQVLAEADLVGYAGSFEILSRRFQFVMRLASLDDPVKVLLGSGDTVKYAIAGNLSGKTIALAPPERYGISTFSTVTERILEGSGEKTVYHGLDFESGSLLTAAAADVSNNESGKKWMTDHSLDLLAWNKGGSKWQLGGPQTQLTPVADEHWEAASVDDLRLALTASHMEEREGLRFLSIRADKGQPLTFALQTGGGTIGILQITDFIENPPALKIRYKLVHPIVLEQLKLRYADKPPTAQTLSFGPVIERVVNHTGENCMIDLDTGTVVTPPAEAFTNGSKSAIAWVARHGIDAAGNVSEISRGLIGFDLIAMPLSNSYWESSDFSSSLQEVVTLSKPGNPIYLSAGPALPTTFFFATREGSKGILQITGFTDSPRGVKMRYKLARPVPLTNAVPETPLPASAVQFRWAAAYSDRNSPVDELPDPSARTGKERIRVLKEVVMDGSHVTKARWQSKKDGTQEMVLYLTESGRQRFARLTADNVGRRLVVVSQGKVLTAPVIQGPINSGRVGWYGNWSEEEVTRIMSAFKSGKSAAPEPTQGSIAQPKAGSLPRFKAVVVCFNGKLDSRSSCSGTGYQPDGTLHPKGNMTCGYPGKVSEIQWSFVEQRGDKDVYRFTRRFPSDTAAASTTTKTVQFSDRRVVVFEDKFQAIVIEPPQK